MLAPRFSPRPFLPALRSNKPQLSTDSTAVMRSPKPISRRTTSSLSTRERSTNFLYTDGCILAISTSRDPSRICAANLVLLFSLPDSARRDNVKPSQPSGKRDMACKSAMVPPRREDSTNVPPQQLACVFPLSHRIGSFEALTDGSALKSPGAMGRPHPRQSRQNLAQRISPSHLQNPRNGLRSPAGGNSSAGGRLTGSSLVFLS